MYVLVITLKEYDPDDMMELIRYKPVTSGFHIKTTPNILDYGLCDQNNITIDQTNGNITSKINWYDLIEFQGDSYIKRNSLDEIEDTSNIVPITEPVPEEFLVIDTINKTVTYDSTLVLDYYKSKKLQELDVEYSNLITNINEYYKDNKPLEGLIDDFSVYNVSNDNIDLAIKTISSKVKSYTYTSVSDIDNDLYSFLFPTDTTIDSNKMLLIADLRNIINYSVEKELIFNLYKNIETQINSFANITDIYNFEPKISYYFPYRG